MFGLLAARRIPVVPPVQPGMIARVTGIYDEPELYQLACAYRDVPAEAGALLAWCDEYYRGSNTGNTGSTSTGAGTVRSVLELAAGPAEHARELARRGLKATALARSAAMCAFAAAQASDPVRRLPPTPADSSWG